MTGFKITTLKAFIATENDGTEGVMAALHGDTWLPLVCADDARVESCREMAKRIGKITGVKKIVLAKFSVREDLEEIN